MSVEVAEQVGLLCVSVEVAEQVGLLCECRGGRTGGLAVCECLGMCDVCAWVCSFHDVWMWSIYAARECGSLWGVGVVCLWGVGVVPYGVWV